MIHLYHNKKRGAEIVFFAPKNRTIFPQIKIIDIFCAVRYNEAMKYIFNAEKINRLLRNFYISTGIAVTFYDAAAHMIATSPVYADYCRCIRQKKECVRNCNLSNVTHMKEAAASNAMVSYTCHAGLMETILPVLYEGTLIGYMQIGQFRDADARYSSEQRALSAAADYGIDATQASSLYRALPTVSAEKLSALQEILLILIQSFWEDGLIRHNRSMLSVRLEQYIDEHLREKLSVERICETFFLSKNALYRLFATEFDTTIGQYVLQKRIALATRLLRESAAPITQVAVDCGFCDYNYFIRAFKKHTGLTPLQFRKEK